jgi:hypothetical protein
MSYRRYHFAAAAAALLAVWIAAIPAQTRAQEPEGNAGFGIPAVFVPKYLGFRADQLASATPDVLRVNLGYVKGLSRSFTSMTGTAAIDLNTGLFTVNLSGLTPGLLHSVWLVDTPDLDGLLDLPISLGTLLPLLGSTGTLTGVLGIGLPAGFTIDRVEVFDAATRSGRPLGAGSVNTFQKIFHRRASLLNESTGALLFDETTLPPLLFGLVPPLDFEFIDSGGLLPLLPLSSGNLTIFAAPDSAERMSSSSSGGGRRSVKLDRLISEGANLFFNERFNGNSRTCGTCHPASNAFTIDPDFIRTRPANDPLFVAEFNPALAQLERPALMRSFGLILENLDGFSPSTRFVMRGVPHTLGMQVSLTRDTSLVPAAPEEMTGWSGDGAPGNGSLREFATGAVTQHFTKNLQRVEGRDFRLPRSKELDAMEAFQLSLGRDRDEDLSRVRFRDANVDTGRQIFIAGTGNPQAQGRCAACHNNGGALFFVDAQNRNFNTNVEDVPHPARSVQNFPKDGGFGRTANPDGTFGNRSFNTASVVEAAESAPFFHNNLVDTLEEVVEFYGGPQFNNPRDATARFSFNQLQRDQLANFMRALNVLQNIDEARRELKELIDNRSDPRSEQDTRLQSAFEDTQDGIDVLNGTKTFSTAIQQLTAARNFIANAQSSTDPAQRRSLANQAITKLNEARLSIATTT